MSEQFLIEQLDEAIDAIVAPASSGAIAFTADEPALQELATLASELRLLPREKFKSSLKETLRRSCHYDGYWNRETTILRKLQRPVTRPSHHT